jgi:hypothetical protein
MRHVVVKLVRGLKIYFISLAMISILMFSAGAALASNDDMLITGNGGNAQPDTGGARSGPQGAQGPQEARPGEPGDNGNQYGSNGSINNGQAGYGNENMTQMNFLGLPYIEWQKWVAAYRSGPKYTYVFNFSSANETGDKNASMKGQKWFNDSWDDSRYGISKQIAVLRIDTLLREMDMLKTMANGSGLNMEERAGMIDSIDNNGGWLADTYKGIQAAGDMKSLGQAVSKAEPRMTRIRSEVKANTGLLACKNMDATIAQAMNTSDLINERIQSPNITLEEKAWRIQKLAEYDQHIYNATRYQANARASFQHFSETGDDAYYTEGLHWINLAQNELDQAFSTLKELFRHLSAGR